MLVSKDDMSNSEGGCGPSIATDKEVNAGQSQGDSRLSLYTKSGMLVITNAKGVETRHRCSIRALRFLAMFVKNGGMPITKESLKFSLWVNADIADNLLAGEATKLRKFLRRCDVSIVIHAVPRVGYWVEFPGDIEIAVID